MSSWISLVSTCAIGCIAVIAYERVFLRKHALTKSGYLFIGGVAAGLFLYMAFWQMPKPDISPVLFGLKWIVFGFSMLHINKAFAKNNENS
jgi:multisubunit Na+/H+ antiporter MnhG subunit